MEKNYYFIRYRLTTDYDSSDTSRVIDIHPFDWVNKQWTPQSSIYTLLDFKEITKEEYDKWWLKL